MIRWEDDKGRARCRATATAQFLYMGDLRQDDKNLVSWPWLDVWDKELGVKLITLGFPLDIESLYEAAKQEIDKKSDLAFWYSDAAKAADNVYLIGMDIAEASISAGKLKNPDTPAHWLEWAESKGYAVEHLRQYVAGTDPAQAGDDAEGEAVRKKYNLEKYEPWMPTALEHADDIYLSALRNNKKPVQKEMAGEIRRRMESGKWVTPKGNPISASNIERWVLRYWMPPEIKD